MLEEMSIRDLGVIEEAVLAPSAGFTVLTGETGAGKTMVLEALGLLLGGRADSGLVRPGTERASVDGRLRMPADSPALARLLDAGAELDDGVLLVSRTVGADGRSRCLAGGRPVPVGVLADVAEELVAVHGQSDQQRLLRPSAQRAALDRFAGPEVTTQLSAYQQAYAGWRAATEQLGLVAAAAKERARFADELRDGLARIDAVKPQSGEEVRLAEDVERLANAEDLRLAAERAHDWLTGELASGDEAGGQGARTAVMAAIRALSAASDHDPALGALAARVAEVGFLVDDIAAEIARYAGGIEADPAALGRAQERLAVLAGLTRRYGANVDAVIAWAGEAKARLAEVEAEDERSTALERDVRAHWEAMGAAAGRLSEARAAAADRFARLVTAQLAELAMPAARLGVSIAQREDPAGLAVGDRSLVFGPFGVDDVELTLAAHADAPTRPLAKAASGGELSRIMLAVEVVFSDADPVPTMVFDEVDAGVGGAAAVEVGRKLAMLGRQHQVLCVTHLAQVAAFADRHLLVTRSAASAVTRSGVVLLEGGDRVRELSRMLAGLADSALAQGHAEELLALAAST